MTGFEISGIFGFAAGSGQAFCPKQAACFARTMPQSKCSSAKNTKRTDHKGQFSLRGPDDRIRTCGILLPKQALYQTEPHPDTRYIIHN